VEGDRSVRASRSPSADAVSPVPQPAATDPPRKKGVLDKLKGIFR
jgi:hypothetical protein